MEEMGGCVLLTLTHLG